MAVARPLAVLGAPPAFAEPLHVGRPNVADQAGFLRRVESMLARRWFTNDGPLVAELEERLARRVGVKHCVLVSNGTTALTLLARAARLTGEVILPSFTFVATAHALEWLGLRPVFSDIDPVTLTLDPVACEAAITPSTSAIIGVHLFGQPCDVEGLQQVADRHGLPLFFDAAHAFGCSHGGRQAGSLAAAEAFSFHATKAFHTFEGGAVATDRDDLAVELRLLRNFGFRGTDTVVALGINGKMPEVCAAMGLANLEAFDATLASSRATFEAYDAGLAGLPGVVLRQRHAARDARNWHYAILEVTDAAAFGMSRDSLAQVLRAENVLARRYFFPGVHAMEPYHHRDPDAGARLPVTGYALSSVLALPAGAEISSDAVAGVCGIIWSAHARAAEVVNTLGSHLDSIGAR